jgi:hypothetical protein
VLNNTVLKLKITPILMSLLAPAASVIRYKNIRWTAGVADDRTPYQGWPSDENNRLWQELYDRMKGVKIFVYENNSLVSDGINRIPMSEARLLTNRTTPIKKDPGYYVITLDVFHELHCLVIFPFSFFC